MSKFKPPAPRAAPGAAFDETRVQAFLSGAQVQPPRGLEPPAANKIVVPDARHKAESERQTEQFVLRMTRGERAALDRAFEASGYRYLHQYVRSLILPHIAQHLDP